MRSAGLRGSRGGNVQRALRRRHNIPVLVDRRMASLVLGTPDFAVASSVDERCWGGGGGGCVVDAGDGAPWGEGSEGGDDSLSGDGGSGPTEGPAAPRGVPNGSS